MRVLFWTRDHFAARHITEALEELPVELVATPDLDAVLEELPHADLFISTDCAAAQAEQLAPALAASPVRWFQFLSAGRERLMAVGLPDKLELFGIDDVLAPAIGEHAMALALALYRGLPGSLPAAGDWETAKQTVRRSMEGDTALIVGMGAIGREVARRARLFDMKVIAATRTPTPNADCDDVRPLTDLAALLPQAGTVFLSVALAPETHHLIGRTEFAQMRKGAFLVNLARGGLVDQVALCEALASGQVGGAGLDVTDPEPLPSDDPLMTAPNVVITPHVSVAGSTRSAERIAALVARNVTAVAARK